MGISGHPGVTSGAAMPMTLQVFDDWLHSYGHAWESRNPQAAADLYVENGTYQVTPFLEPIRGKQAILEYWTHVAQTQQNIQFGYEILAVTPEHGIVRWWASFVIVPPGLPTKLDGIFLISLDENGRCHSLREWWHKQQD
jgi:hypothetical protein